MDILIAYSTLTNNTEDAATSLHSALAKQFPNLQFYLFNIRDLTIVQIKQYPLIFFGSPTWDDGPTADTEEFLQNMAANPPDFSQNQFALFGLGDISYEPFFCASIYEVQKQLVAYKAHVYEKVFTIDGYPLDDTLAKLAKWGKTVVDQRDKF